MPSTTPSSGAGAMGRLDVLARDPRIVGPDGIFATREHVFVTLGQWSRLPAFDGGRDLRTTAFSAPPKASRPLTIASGALLWRQGS